MTLQVVRAGRHALYHRVRVVHGGTGKPLAALRASLRDPVWHGWTLQRKGPDVLLSTSERFEAARPASTEVEIVLDDPVAAARFPAVDGRRGVARVTLARDADADVELTLQPDPVRLEVALVRRDGTPRAGLTNVQARNTPHTVPLAETAAGSGVYGADAAWRPGSYRIFVGGTQRGALAVDYRRAVTRVRLIVP